MSAQLEASSGDVERAVPPRIAKSGVDVEAAARAQLERIRDLLGADWLRAAARALTAQSRASGGAVTAVVTPAAPAAPKVPRDIGQLTKPTTLSSALKTASTTDAKLHPQLSAGALAMIFRTRAYPEDLVLYVLHTARKMPQSRSAFSEQTVITLHDGRNAVVAILTTPAARDVADALAPRTLVRVSVGKYLPRAREEGAELLNLRLLVSSLAPVKDAPLGPVTSITAIDLRAVQPEGRDAVKELGKVPPRQAVEKKKRSRELGAASLSPGLEKKKIDQTVTPDVKGNMRDKASRAVHHSCAMEDGVALFRDAGGVDSESEDGRNGDDSSGPDDGGDPGGESSDDAPAMCTGDWCSILGYAFPQCVAETMPPTVDDDLLREMYEMAPQFSDDLNPDALLPQNIRFLQYYWYAVQVYGRHGDGDRVVLPPCITEAVRALAPAGGAPIALVDAIPPMLPHNFDESESASSQEESSDGEE